MPVEIKAIDKEKGTLTAIFSTQDVDRHGDTVMQEGWDLVNFKKNPVILNSHSYADAADVIGRADNVRVEGKKLLGDITFAVAENPKAKVIFDLYAGKFLHAFSVGFMVKKYKENKDGSKDWWIIEEAELLEVSAVSVPANARALAKAKGIDVDQLPNEKEYAEENNEDDKPDEISEDNEVQDPIEPKPTEDGDGGKGEQGNGDEEDKPNAGGDGSAKPVSEEAEAEPGDETVEEPVTPKSAGFYYTKVAGALSHIQEAERARLKKASAIIQGLLYETTTEHAPNVAKQKSRRHQINKAVRLLLENK